MKKLLTIILLTTVMQLLVFAQNNMHKPYNASKDYATINGRVTNALDGSAIEGAFVQIGGLSATTDANGNYQITNIPPAELTADFSATPISGEAPLNVQFNDLSRDGYYVLSVSKENFITYINNYVAIGPGETLTIDVSLSPIMNEGEYRIVLNWGADPRDLDSHLKTPPIDGTEYEIYYSNTGSSDAPPYATLDHDDTDGFGPETITIYQMFSGTYKYYVHHYTGDGTLTTSNAVVQVYNQNGLVKTITVPTEGTGAYWNVLTIDGSSGSVTVINEIVEAPPSKMFQIQDKKSSKDITNWSWEFGDGATSTEQNPQHTYTAAGSYTVKLTVSNGQESNTKIYENFITVLGQENILTENFDGEEFPPSGWTTQVTNQDYTWLHGNPQDNAFNNIDPTNVYSAICPWVSQDQNEWLISKSFNLGAGNATLTFWRGCNEYWTSSATTKVYISINNSDNWVKIWELEESSNDSWNWQEVSIDISAYSNNTGIRIAWQYVGNDGDLFAIDNVVVAGAVSDVNEISGNPTQFELKQNYPNPFNPTTTINFSIPENVGNVSITVYNALGQTVASLINKPLSSGSYQVKFNAANLPSGIYMYQLRAGNFTAIKKMMLLK